MVLSPSEVQALLRGLRGVKQLVAMLLYGSGLRLLKALRLRIKDLDFEYAQILVRGGKATKTVSACCRLVVHDLLQAHLERVKRLHEHDLAFGAGNVELPGALARKSPAAARAWVWQWVFPATTIYRDAETGELRRHHLHETSVQRAVKEAVLRAGIAKQASCHALRHSFATHDGPVSHDGIHR